MKLSIQLFAFLIFSFAFETHANRRTLPDATKTRVLKVLKINESLHSLFFQYDPAKIIPKAQEMKSAINEIRDEQIKQLLNLSKNKLDEINATSDRKKNNKAYDFVSKALVHIVKTYDVGKYNAYSCPMVKKVWVQNSGKQDAVQNPYAPEMPSCGSKDTNF